MIEFDELMKKGQERLRVLMGGRGGDGGANGSGGGGGNTTTNSNSLTANINVGSPAEYVDPLKKALREAGNIYADLKNRGAYALRAINIGGGLAAGPNYVPTNFELGCVGLVLHPDSLLGGETIPLTSKVYYSDIELQWFIDSYLAFGATPNRAESAAVIRKYRA